MKIATTEKIDNDNKIYTRPRLLPPTKFKKTNIDRSLISDGCIINAKEIVRSVIGNRSRIGDDTTIQNCYVMGNDFYQNINDMNRVGQLGGRLLPALSKSMQVRHQNLIGLEKLRSSLGYEQVLARGFALVRDASGHPLRNVDAARAQNRLEIQFSDGRILVSPADGPPPKPKKSNNSSGDKSTIPQGSLF